MAKGVVFKYRPKAKKKCKFHAKSLTKSQRLKKRNRKSGK